LRLRVVVMTSRCHVNRARSVRITRRRAAANRNPAVRVPALRATIRKREGHELLTDPRARGMSATSRQRAIGAEATSSGAGTTSRWPSVAGGRGASCPPGAALAGSRLSAPGGHAAPRHGYVPLTGVRFSVASVSRDSAALVWRLRDGRDPNPVPPQYRRGSPPAAPTAAGDRDSMIAAPSAPAGSSADRASAEASSVRRGMLGRWA
jgi:hypothetical protein